VVVAMFQPTREDESRTRLLIIVAILGLLALLVVAGAAHAADQPYVEISATSGLVFSEVPGPEASYWDKQEYVGLRVVGRLPYRDFALVARGDVTGVPGTFAYDKPGSFKALVGDVGLTWTPARVSGIAIGGIASYGEIWSLGDDRGPARASVLGLGLTARHEATHSWVAVGVVDSDFYGGFAPRLLVHGTLYKGLSMEADAIWRRAPTLNLSILVGWKK
jgi:hypothetical protein